MSQMVQNGGYEPEPEGPGAVISFTELREVDKGWVLRQHMFQMLFQAEISEVRFSEMPAEIGKLLVDYTYRSDLNQIQQN